MTYRTMLDIFDYKKIIVIGNNGSGKSHLSKELSKITGLPLIHLDLEYWQPNWQGTSKNEWIEKQKAMTSQKEWIIDGNHTETMEIRFSKADLIIFLDINRVTCLKSVILRHKRRNNVLPDCLERKFDKNFFLFCKRLWTFSTTRRPIIFELQKKYPDKELLIIRKRKKVNYLLGIWRDKDNDATKQL